MHLWVLHSVHIRKLLAFTEATGKPPDGNESGSRKGKGPRAPPQAVCRREGPFPRAPRPTQARPARTPLPGVRAARHSFLGSPSKDGPDDGGDDAVFTATLRHL